MELDLWILSALTALAGAAIGAAGPWVRRISPRPLEDLAVLGELSAIAVPLAERRLPAAPGAEKMDEAVRLVSRWLVRRGVRLAPQEIEAAVERAWSERAAGRARGTTDRAS